MSTAATVDVEVNSTNTCVDQSNDVEVEPTLEELSTLEQIADRIPVTAWLLIFAQLCEGFTFFGTYTIFPNYIQFPVPNEGNKQPGALYLGRKAATAMTMSYYCLCNLSPIGAAIIADQFWGKYKTITIACFIYLVGLIILVFTSIPTSIQMGAGLPGLICAMVIMGVAAGGFKTTVIPFMAEQYPRKTSIVRHINGQKKIISPRIWSYWASNAGSLISKFITPTSEKYHSFWLAYLIPLIVFPGCLIALLIGRRRYIRVPPASSLVVRAFRTMQKMLYHLMTAKQRRQKNKNQFIDDLKQTMRACRVFVFFPFFWVCYNQAIANLIPQAAQMNVGSIPNDILQMINNLVIVIFVPIFDKIIYPTLRTYNINLSPIIRITCGFLIAAFGIAWIAIVQYWIYATGPNFNYTTEPCWNCQKFNNISIVWQVPSYFFLAIGEIFAAITGAEYAYTNAPDTMKSIVMSLFVCTRAVGSLLNLSLVPLHHDPEILWMYVSLAIVTFIIAIIFYILFRNDGKQVLPKDELQHNESILSVTKY